MNRLVYFVLQELIMSRNQTIRFDITSRTLAGNLVYEATASIPGFAPVPVSKIENGSTQFTTRSSITSTCNNRATSLGLKPVLRFSNTVATCTSGAKTKIATKNVRRTKVSR
jgi:hypothetical protein